MRDDDGFPEFPPSFRLVALAVAVSAVLIGATALVAVVSFAIWLLG